MPFYYNFKYYMKQLQFNSNHELSQNYLARKVTWGKVVEW